MSYSLNFYSSNGREHGKQNGTGLMRDDLIGIAV